MTSSLNEKQIDALREATNIGAGRAVGALAAMTGETLWIEVPDVRLVRFAEVPEMLGGGGSPAAGVLFRLTGDLSAALLLLFPLPRAVELGGLLTRAPGDPKVLEREIGTSALAEAGNIMAGALVSALADLLHLRIDLSVPHFAADLLGAVVDTALADVGRHADQALVLKTEFRTKGKPIAGNFLLLPDPRSLGGLLKALGTV